MRERPSFNGPSQLDPSRPPRSRYTLRPTLQHPKAEPILARKLLALSPRRQAGGHEDQAGQVRTAPDAESTGSYDFAVHSSLGGLPPAGDS